MHYIKTAISSSERTVPVNQVEQRSPPVVDSKMDVYFEELSPSKRAGGIEAATRGLVSNLERVDVRIIRSSVQAWSSGANLPDCVHIHGLWSPHLAKRCYHWQRHGVPCVISPHGMLEPWALGHKRFKKWVAWCVYQRHLVNGAAALHVTSQREAANCRRLGLLPAIEPIPWGISVPSTVDRRNDARPPRAHRTALFVGRICPAKGLDMLVQAWAMVRPPCWQMKIVGPDEAGYRAEIESLVRETQVGDSFQFVGELNGQGLEQAYQEAELFVLPSYTENFGFVVGEALAREVPVIVTQGAPWEGIGGRRCGWWPTASVDGIAAALAEASRLSNAELRQMGSRGRDWILSEYSWSITADRMAALYRSITTNRSLTAQ